MKFFSILFKIFDSIAGKIRLELLIWKANRNLKKKQ